MKAEWKREQNEQHQKVTTQHNSSEHINSKHPQILCYVSTFEETYIHVMFFKQSQKESILISEPCDFLLMFLS